MGISHISSLQFRSLSDMDLLIFFLLILRPVGCFGLAQLMLRLLRRGVSDEDMSNEILESLPDDGLAKMSSNKGIIIAVTLEMGEIRFEDFCYLSRPVYERAVQ